MSFKFKKIGCITDFSSKTASSAYQLIMDKYNFHDANDFSNVDYDLIIALGGDGLMLKVLHRYIELGTPIYGMNRGSIGFLLNDFNVDDLMARIERAIKFSLVPLEMTAQTVDGKIHKELAVNEVSLLRQTSQAAKLKIYVDGHERLNSLVCDGILISTPAGSTAYNFAANGPIIPLDSNILAMTPISPFRPRRWRGALLSHQNRVKIEIIDADKRPVSAVADFNEVRDIITVEIYERRDLVLNLLFDQENNIQDRIIKEQFIT